MDKIQKAEFKIYKFEGLKIVNGYIVELSGVKFGLHYEGYYWCVTDLKTAHQIRDGRTKDEAILNALFIWYYHPDIKNAIKSAIKTLKRKRIKYPVQSA